MKEGMVLQCQYCGEIINPGPTRRKYCSDRCRNRAKNARTAIARLSAHKKVYICRYCGKEFRSEQASREFCGHDCLRNYMRDMHAQNREQHDMRRIRITKEIPIFPELRPVVGAVYEAERYGSRYFSAKFYIIPDICGKRIVVRGGECVEV